MAFAIVACLGWVITTYLFIRHLRDVNHGHRLHISGLLNRIQAPQEAVVKDLVGDEPYEPIVLAHTERSYWEEVEHVPQPQDAD